ncbi:NUAK family SNF1-like kinase 2 [Hypsizygus marmoreus]|uniref:NUAK family SNF1-like kinase 2 n=1 Tax=Hypsizygus marmoreus TaxID=39966 RepID=A0A369JUB6_HYPMA|nr:NUAK family SNF1-like kinase 2 [Hypsizygus marmoreus]
MPDSLSLPPMILSKLDADVQAANNGKLFIAETFWRDHSKLLLEHGYSLRKRYQPDWVASWLDKPDKAMGDCEDGVYHRFPQIIDAVRADGTLVALKRINLLTHPQEAEIGTLLSSKTLASHPKNHCVPILEVIPIPDDHNTVVIVMPLLYPNEYPPFETIGEAVEFLRQILEGLQFMHQNNIAHRDCKYDNIMADALPLYDSPPHPFRLEQKRDFSGSPPLSSSRTRTPIKYYLVDFGLSKIYKADDAPYLELPWGAGDKTVPEFKSKDGTLCDPFRVDVYCIGNAVRQNFLETRGNLGYEYPKRGFGFLRELVLDMVKEDPNERPTMDEVVARFTDLTGRLSNWKLRSRVALVNEKPLTRALRSLVHWARQLEAIRLGMPAIPRS